MSATAKATASPSAAPTPRAIWNRRLLYRLLLLVAVFLAVLAAVNISFPSVVLGIAVLALVVLAGFFVYRLSLQMEDEARRRAAEAQDKERLVRRLRYAEERTRKILDTAGDGILTFDELGLIKSVNREALRIFGYRPNELRGAKIATLINGPISGLGDQMGTGEAKVLGASSGVEGKRKDGSTFPVEPAVSVMRAGGRRQVIYVVRDLTQQRLAEELLRQAHDELEAKVEERTGQLLATNRQLVESNRSLLAEINERKRIEEALRSSEERYRGLVDLAPDAIFIYKGDQIVFINPAGLHLFGAASEKEILGKMLSDVIHPDYHRTMREHLRRVLDAQQPAPHIEEQIVRLDGGALDVEVAASTFNDHGTMAIQVVLRDISDRKRAEATQRDYAGQLRALSRKLMDAQEAERRRIARELHDEIGQSLTAIKINLQAGKRVTGEAALPLLEDSISLTERTLAQVRNLSLDLRPATLDELGLVPSLRWLLDRQAQRTGFTAHLDADAAAPRLAPHLETACFRVVQEALTNVVRHAQAKDVWVSLRQQPDELHLTIRDDGIGFDVTAARLRAAHGGSLGLLGLQERVQLVGGVLTLQSTQGRGTEIQVRIPLTSAAGATADGTDPHFAG